MKKTLLLVIVFFCACAQNVYSQPGVGIGTATPDPSSILDVTSTTQGLLPPRMTTAQRNAISSPVQGLMIFNTTDLCLNFYDGLSWINWCNIVSSTQIPTDTVYTSNTTWIKPPGLVYIEVQMVGGGGGGGGCYGYGAGAGAAGGYSRKRIAAASLGSSEIITIGAAGIGGAPQTAGGNGGTTSFGLYCSATGGEGGKAQTSTGVNSTDGSIGGMGIGGDINIPGPSSGGVVGSAEPVYGGASSLFGAGATPRAHDVSMNGFNASGYGSGGGGGVVNGATNFSGGNGSAGVVIVTEYFR